MPCTGPGGFIAAMQMSIKDILGMPLILLGNEQQAVNQSELQREVCGFPK